MALFRSSKPQSGVNLAQEINKATTLEHAGIQPTPPGDQEEEYVFYLKCFKVRGTLGGRFFFILKVFKY